jgi:hypothetical protein
VDVSAGTNSSYSFRLLLQIIGEPNNPVRPVSRRQLSIIVEYFLLLTLR